jgi:hypothetical protein
MRHSDDMLESPSGGRAARLTSSKKRRALAVAMAAVGVAALAVAIGWDPAPGQRPDLAKPAQGGQVSVDNPQIANSPDGSVVGAGVVVPATDEPGGIGPAPEKTGLPAKPGGGTVRTGAAEDGCFSDIRSYLDKWHQTGQEPDPCFTSQPASNQDQPSGVARSYNGQTF